MDLSCFLSRHRRFPGRPREVGLGLLLLGLALVLSASHAAQAQELEKAGTVAIEQVQIAFIGSGNLGGGKLHFGGKTYEFTVGGLGIGGIGISRMKATGTVYNLKNVADFPGGYVQARYGFAVGAQSGGQLWLQNTHGVVIELKAEREGLALSLGGDAVYIKLD